MLTRPDIKLAEVFLYLCGLVAISVIFILTDSFIIMFLMFESLLATALALLKLTSKSERIGEAVSEMFMWTLFGSFFLLLGFFCLYTDLNTYAFTYTQYQSNGIICLLFVIGFGVKIPL
jgi:formate hydrogenlyase subunit 3/multisubunit Na+/H+ antiporter MnhD subunit